MRTLNPEVFQGTLSKKNYFEGWYFKHVSSTLEHVFAFIPGISLSPDDPHAFIQVLNGITGESHYVTYPIEQFQFKHNRLHVQVGDSVFTDKSIDLNIQSEGLKVQGRLEYFENAAFPKSIISPGIMGWYSWVPFMECYHGVVSANHFIEGSLQVNGVVMDFSGGKGYIEKDWGTSFPECWIWLHSNSFERIDASVFVSIAKIPWLGRFFMGHIAFLYLGGKYYKFATYNRSKLSLVQKEGDILTIVFENNRYSLHLVVKTQNAGDLIAPVRGTMSRRIKESIDSEVHVILRHKMGDIIFEGSSKRAGLEIIEEIFGYL